MVKRGRPPGSLTLAKKEKIDRFISEIKRGNFIKTAAALAGISDSAVFGWIKTAKSSENKKELNQFEKQCVEFRDRFLQADAEALDRHIQFIITDDDWKARQWFLLHRYPDIFRPEVIKFEGDIKTENTVKADPTLIKALGDALVSLRSGTTSG